MHLFSSIQIRLYIGYLSFRGREKGKKKDCKTEKERKRKVQARIHREKFNDIKV